MLSRHPITSGVFCGVYASNKLPHSKLERYPAAFVANVDPDTKPGSQLGGILYSRQTAW